MLRSLSYFFPESLEGHRRASSEHKPVDRRKIMLDSPMKKGLEAEPFCKKPLQFRRQGVMKAVHLAGRRHRTCQCNVNVGVGEGILN